MSPDQPVSSDRPSGVGMGQEIGHDDCRDDAHDDGAQVGLWPGDTGTLHDGSRRALLRLLQGPYVSGRANPQLWAALVADEKAIRSRLHDLFLDLVIDRVDEFAFTRKVRTTQADVPQALRSERLTFVDTAMLLVLRQLLLSAAGEPRVIVGQEEVYERLSVYRDGDESTYLRNLNGAWTRMKNRFRVLHDVGEDRVEISPVVKFLIDEEQVGALSRVYARLAESDEPTLPDADADADAAETDDGEAP